MQNHPVVPLRGQVMFPGVVLVLDVAGEAWSHLAEAIVAGTVSKLLFVTQLSGDPARPAPTDLARIGVVGEVQRLTPLKQGWRLAVHGLERRRVEAFSQLAPYLIAESGDIEETEGTGGTDAAYFALVAEVRELALELVRLWPDAPRDAAETLRKIDGPGELADRIAVHLGLGVEWRLDVLETLDVRARLEKVKAALVKRNAELAAADLGDPKMREQVLRERMRAIQEQLGEKGDDEAGDELAKKIDEADMPPEALATARRELRRLRGMQPAAPDYQITRTYLEWMTELPWSKRTEDKLDLAAARAVLDADHHGLEKIKKRVLEYLAVRKLKPSKKGPILLFAGPPGVGKTSLGKSIARALGREFVRASLGGVSDEAAIRGHRRTYIGALPGRIIRGMRDAGTRNPVFLLDEVDKLGADYRGDPSSALLEVLDPEQNNTFSDHYLEVPFDLSEVIFIVTANDLSTIPDALFDRMELIEIAGYTPAEKRAIAERHLVPKQLLEHGLTTDHVTFTRAALDEIIEAYTREAGVRNLERAIAGVVRGVAVKVAAGEVFPAEVGVHDVAVYLGPPQFFSDTAETFDQPGIATGMAWTPSGGQILFIETSLMPGHGKVALTGHLGDVMKESAQAALSLVRSRAELLGVPPETFANNDFHVHVPSGGTPKDGPSAGNALVAALVSLVTGRRVRGDVALTGEITLRGLVLPVGGVASKVLAAHRAGVKTVILPERNAKDVADIPEEVRGALRIELVRDVDHMLDLALEPKPALALTPAGPVDLAISDAWVPEKAWVPRGSLAPAR